MAYNITRQKDRTPGLLVQSPKGGTSGSGKVKRAKPAGRPSMSMSMSSSGPTLIKERRAARIAAAATEQHKQILRVKNDFLQGVEKKLAGDSQIQALCSGDFQWYSVLPYVVSSVCPEKAGAFTQAFSNTVHGGLSFTAAYNGLADLLSNPDFMEDGTLEKADAKLKALAALAALAPMSSDESGEATPAEILGACVARYYEESRLYKGISGDTVKPLSDDLITPQDHASQWSNNEFQSMARPGGVMSSLAKITLSEDDIENLSFDCFVFLQDQLQQDDEYANRLYSTFQEIVLGAKVNYEKTQQKMATNLLFPVGMIIDCCTKHVTKESHIILQGLVSSGQEDVTDAVISELVSNSCKGATESPEGFQAAQLGRIHIAGTAFGKDLQVLIDSKKTESVPMEVQTQAIANAPVPTQIEWNLSTPEMTKRLDGGDLGTILSTIRSITNCSLLALHLGLFDKTYKAIEINVRSKVDSVKMEVISSWLKWQDNVQSVGLPSWKVLVEALQKMGEHRTAEDICKKHSVSHAHAPAQRPVSVVEKKPSNQILQERASMRDLQCIYYPSEGEKKALRIMDHVGSDWEAVAIGFELEPFQIATIRQDCSRDQVYQLFSKLVAGKVGDMELTWKNLLQVLQTANMPYLKDLVEKALVAKESGYQ